MPQSSHPSAHGYTTDSFCSQFSSFNSQQLHELQQCIDSAIWQALRHYSSTIQGSIRKDGVKKESLKALITQKKAVTKVCACCKKEFESKNKLFRHLRAYGHTKQGFSRLNQSSTSPPASQQGPRTFASSPPYDHSVQAQPMVLPQISSPPHYEAQSQPCTPPHTPQEAPQISVSPPDSLALFTPSSTVQLAQQSFV